MEVTLAISEALGIFRVAKPLLSLRIHYPDLGTGPGFTTGTGTARLRIIRGFLLPGVSADLPSDPIVKPCLGQSELIFTKCIYKAGNIWGLCNYPISELWSSGPEMTSFEK